MKKDFSPSWKGSKQPRKQRKYVYNMPLHLKGHLMSVHLSPALRTKHAKRSIRVVKEDKVKVTSGQFKGRTGKVEKVNTGYCKVTIVGIEVTKKDGSKTSYPFHPSNLMIEELNLSDKKRMKTAPTTVSNPVSNPVTKTTVKPVPTAVKKEETQ